MKPLKPLLLIIPLGMTFPHLGHTQGSLLWSYSITNSFYSANIFDVANFWWITTIRIHCQEI